MTTNSILKPNPVSRKFEENADPNLYKIQHLTENFNIGKFYELTPNEGEGYNFEVTDNISYTLYIAESRPHECPKLQIKIAGEEIQALVDTGCELSILNENLYNKLKHAVLQCPELPTQHVNLVSAFNDKSKRVKKQALLEVNIGGTKLDQVVLLSAQLLTEAILGLDFLINYETEISFPERRITLRVHEEVFDFEFAGAKGTSANRFCDLGRMPVLPQTKHPSTAVNKGHCYTKNSATGVADESVLDQERESGTCVEDSEYLLDDDKECECLLNDDNEASIQQRLRNCAENAIAAKHGRGCKFCRNSCATFAEVMGSLNTDRLFADKYELIKDSNVCNNEVADCTSLCLATTCPKTDDGTSPQESGTNKLGTDDRTISEEQLRAKVQIRIIIFVSRYLISTYKNYYANLSSNAQVRYNSEHLIMSS